MPAPKWYDVRRPQGDVDKRRRLREAGYDVDKKGPIGQRALRAWNYYTKHGASGASDWNARQRNRRGGPGVGGLAGAVADVAGAVRSATKKVQARSMVAKASPVPKKKVTHARAKAQAAALGAQPTGTPDDELGNTFPGVPGAPTKGFRTGKQLPRQFAEQLAGLQFDPQINELLTQMKMGKRDLAQREADIGGWYGQVGQSLATAGQRDIEAGGRARGDVERALQGIVTSLGGSRGAAGVAQAGLADLTNLAAQGASQERYNADLAPLLQQESAAARSRQAALSSQEQAKQRQALVGLRGQRGQAQTKALMDIIQFNQQGRQQNFQNKLALQNAALAAASLGLNAEQTAAAIGAQRAGVQQNWAKLKLAQRELGLKAQGEKPITWARLNYPDRQTVVQNAVQQAVAQMDPANFDEDFARFAAFKTLRAGGFKSAQGKAFQGRVPSRQSRRQIQAAVDAAVRQAKRQWESKQR